jgi:hypothetical protein
MGVVSTVGQVMGQQRGQIPSRSASVAFSESCIFTDMALSLSFE